MSTGFLHSDYILNRDVNRSNIQLQTIFSFRSLKYNQFSNDVAESTQSIKFAIPRKNIPPSEVESKKSKTKQKKLRPMSLDDSIVLLRDSTTVRNNIRKKLIEKYKNKRRELKIKIKEAKSFDERIHWHYQIQNLPRDSAPTRYRNRCSMTGRPRGFDNFFQLSRQMARYMIQQGYFPGVEAASW